MMRIGKSIAHIQTPTAICCPHPRVFLRREIIMGRQTIVDCQQKNILQQSTISRIGSYCSDVQWPSPPPSPGLIRVLYFHSPAQQFTTDVFIRVCKIRMLAKKKRYISISPSINQHRCAIWFYNTTAYILVRCSDQCGSLISLSVRARAAPYPCHKAPAQCPRYISHHYLNCPSNKSPAKTQINS